MADRAAPHEGHWGQDGEYGRAGLLQPAGPRRDPQGQHGRRSSGQEARQGAQAGSHGDCVGRELWGPQRSLGCPQVRASGSSRMGGCGLRHYPPPSQCLGVHGHPELCPLCHRPTCSWRRTSGTWQPVTITGEAPVRAATLLPSRECCPGAPVLEGSCSVLGGGLSARLWGLAAGWELELVRGWCWGPLI